VDHSFNPLALGGESQNYHLVMDRPYRDIAFIALPPVSHAIPDHAGIDRSTASHASTFLPDRYLIDSD
jgi:hypothetical protein